MIIFFTHFIGALIYLFVVKLNKNYKSLNIKPSKITKTKQLRRSTKNRIIAGVCGGLIALSIILMGMDIFMPVTESNMLMIWMFKILGLGFSFIGLFILLARIGQTGVGYFLDIPNTSNVILMHQRRGKNPNTKFLKGTLTDLEFIKTKKVLI